ncbi:GMC family oxidoreductase [Yoonia sp. R2331]|uniref:GMC family oxidoreductase n=1 Tax=Yoonia sp. R2331 TaxID=3237238 RepID=UPI0034E39D90
MPTTGAYDVIVVGAGSAGCAVAAGLARAGVGRIAVVEAGPTDAHPFVKMPFGLIWLMGSRRDWRLKSAPQQALGGRQITIPRGRMLGGSGSINSMVWFRGQPADFDAWNVPGWGWADVEPAFAEVEAAMTPTPLDTPHPLSRALGRLFGANAAGKPDPARQSAGVCDFNLRDGRRWSPADAFLRPVQDRGVTVLTGHQVRRLDLTGRAANAVEFTDGTRITAAKGVVLSAGAIGSPEILLRSGVGPAADLAAADVPLVLDAPQVGANLHDHPGVGLHFAGAESGYGLTWKQAANWALAPLNYLVRRKGVFASPTVEAAAFFNARDEDTAPDIQSHFIPFFMNWKGGRLTYGSGYFADVCLCRPKSRGALRITPQGTAIDLGLFNDPSDLDTMVVGLKRLRQIIASAPFGDRAAPEAYPAGAAQTDADIRQFILDRCGTAYHPVGTLRMGQGDAPVAPDLAVKGIRNLWVADASVMPSITSANTNAPSIMIGHRAGQIIAKAVA